MTEFRQIGRPIHRLEDPPLLRGKGRYVDDIHIHGTLEVAFLRSPHAHAIVNSIDASAARNAPGVVAIYTFADLLPHMKRERLPLQFRSSTLPQDIMPFPLAKDEVAFVGETVAMVVAESRYLAEDAVPLIEVDYDILPAVSDCREAAMPGAPLAHRGKKNNIMTEISQSYGDVAAAFVNPPHRVAVSLKQHRGGAHSIEGRGVLADYDASDDKLTVWTSTQAAHEVRAHLTTMLGLDENQLRLVTPDVGGGFGAKFLLYPEEVCVAVASRLLERPVRWIEDRREHFLASIQERDQYWELEAACDKEGHLLGVRGRMINDQGAYTPQGINLAYNASTAVPGPYLLPAYELKVQVVETNKVTSMPVRGAGYPEGCFAMERVMDEIADTLKIDRVELRRRNLVPPERMPYQTPLKSRSGSSITYDSGDFHHILNETLIMADQAGFAARQKAALEQGRYLGFGVAVGMKGTGRGPFESALVRIGRSGRVSLYTGAMPMGQGLKTAMAQICAEQLGVEPNEITVICGDTSTIPLGLGGFASRQTVTAGSSTHMAASAVRQKVLNFAAHVLEASAEDLELKDGRVEVKGVPGHGMTLGRVAEMLAGDPGYSIPGHFEAGLESFQNFQPDGLTYGMACHAVEVEVDIATGAVTMPRYAVSNDCGRAVNPVMVEGQIVGGAVHGIGNALFEYMAYDANAQPVTTTLAEYLLVTATELPHIDVKLLEYPAVNNPLGIKGVGEAGTVPAAAAIVAAIENALTAFNVRVGEVPILPTRLVELINAGRK